MFESMEPRKYGDDAWLRSQVEINVGFGEAVDDGTAKAEGFLEPQTTSIYCHTWPHISVHDNNLAVDRGATPRFELNP